jgi:hypothetical protein
MAIRCLRFGFLIIFNVELQALSDKLLAISFFVVSDVACNVSTWKISDHSIYHSIPPGRSPGRAGILSFTIHSFTINSITLKRIHRVHHGSFDGLVAYSDQGYDNGSCACHHKYPPFYRDFIFKIIQPFVHKIPGYRAGGQ